MPSLAARLAWSAGGRGGRLGVKHSLWGGSEVDLVLGDGQVTPGQYGRGIAETPVIPDPCPRLYIVSSGARSVRVFLLPNGPRRASAGGRGGAAHGLIKPNPQEHGRSPRDPARETTTVSRETLQ